MDSPMAEAVEKATVDGFDGMNIIDENGSRPAIENEGDLETNSKTKINNEKHSEQEDESTVSSSGDDGEAFKVTPMDSDNMESIILEALSLKEEGNTHFKADDLEKASGAYRRGVNSLKKFNSNNTGNDQVKGLLCTLLTNFSMVRYKQQKYKVSAELAGKAIRIDGKNVKAFYRRALAYRKMGELEQARDDLRKALQIEPGNVSCKKELALVKRDLEQTKENQKKALSKAFSSKSGSFLYSDKEELEKRKKEEAKRKKEEEQELHNKLKSEWENECVKLMAKNQAVESFEEWEKRKRMEEEANRNEEEKKRKELEKNKKNEVRNAKKKAHERQQESEQDSDSDILTEKEIAMMRGYKKTSDGRTTSYFSRELDEEEKKRIGSTAPRRLQDGTTTDCISNSQTGTSIWNQAQTWEEKDTTDWCKGHLRKYLAESRVSNDKMDCSIVSVDEIAGDASVAMAGRKKKYIFDFHLKMSYELRDSEKGNVVGSGIVCVPDMCSVSHNELEVIFESWKNRPGEMLINHAIDTRSLLVGEIRKQVHRWVQDFNNEY